MAGIPVHEVSVFSKGKTLTIAYGTDYSVRAQDVEMSVTTPRLGSKQLHFRAGNYHHSSKPIPDRDADFLTEEHQRSGCLPCCGKTPKISKESNLVKVTYQSSEPIAVGMMDYFQ